MILNYTQKLARIFTGFLFVALLVTGINAQDLKGKWKLIEMKVDGANFTLTKENTPTLIFSEENRVGGNGGCNRYGTTYELQNKAIDFKSFITTKMACVSERRNQQEVKYFFALEEVDRFEMAKEGLVFMDENRKTVLKFAPLALTNGKLGI